MTVPVTAALAAWDPLQLPASGSPDRWPWLQGLRRSRDLDLEPWLRAVESGQLLPAPDLLGALADRLDGPAAARLLAWWLAEPAADPALLAVIGRHRHPRCRVLLRQALEAASTGAGRNALLLPLLGHQRDPADFTLLRQRALAPLPLQQRRAALEGLAVGLAAWPLAPLRQTLRHLIGDLDPALAATAVDLVARLPGGSADLADLDRGRLAPELARRVERRLAGAGPVTAAG
ncbi:MULTISPECIES: hypothetical protein [unclassified Cyanobium]|uniref:hypothetical protein n=1 Tax=unclassified Cyanobium TaxID=2627006 RepID=UPI0020CFE193|nr:MULTISPECIES: hypothetical protein [unclassified Cyanobium]MCP9834287.1 hypothetical protein [Cyanobium sp. La Preciosa 7G6]MCP9937077.1 hypothetical protein [Cyanobium sp. Aljojuca 7A6]